MKANTETRILAYVRHIRSAEALHQAVSRELLIDGLTASQFSTLKVLRLHGPLALREIAKYILKSGGNMTIVVDNLERDGLVTRERNTEDRRIVYVSLTAKGKEIFDRIYPQHLERIRSAMSGLSDYECEVLMNLLDKLSPQEQVLECTSTEISSAAVAV